MLRERGGAITTPRDSASLYRGSDRESGTADGLWVTTAARSSSARLAVSTAVAALVLVLMLAARAEGSGRSWDAYLAPAGTCQGESNASASLASQARAIDCLVNWARMQGHRSSLTQRPALEKAAALKGRVVASCGQFSHTPCGTSMSASVRKSGYRFTFFGENLFAGPWGTVTPRDVVAAWLNSPRHRANLFGRRFRDLGVAPARAHDLLGPGDAVVWTATFATPQ